MKFLDNIPFVVLLFFTGAVFGGAGVLFVNGDSNLAGLVSFLCAMGGIFGGFMTLRQRGLKPMATMAEFLESEEK
jgi:hypothetical protein